MTEAVGKFIPIFVGVLLILRGLFWIIDGKHGNKRSYFFGIAVNRVFSGFVKRDIDSESFGFL